MKKLGWAVLPAFFIASAAWADNYSATQGSGTTFASHVVTAVNYQQFMLCDFTLGTAQCAGVNASGQVLITGPVTQSGTWNVNQAGTWNMRLQDGSGNAITSSTRGAQQPLSVQVLDASGNQVTAFGGSGGTASNFSSAFPSSGTAIGVMNSGGTAMTNLKVDASNALQANISANMAAGGASPTTALPAGGIYNLSAPSPATGQFEPFQLDSSGNLRVVVNAQGTLNANGQAANTASAPVVISNQQMTAAGSASTTQVMAVQGTTGMTPLTMNNPTSEYPNGAVPVTGSATTATTASTVTLTSSAAHTMFLCSVSYRSNATAAVTGNLTIAGLITGTINYMHWTAPLANGIGITEEVFSPCIPASAQATNIVITSPVPGSGGNSSLSATGYLIAGNGY